MEDVLLENPTKFLEFIQDAAKQKNVTEAEKAVEIARLIARTLEKINRENEESAWNKLNVTKRQTILSLAFRAYKQIILKHNFRSKNDILKAQDFLSIGNELEFKRINYEMLYAYLQSENEIIADAEIVLEVCLKRLKECRIDQDYLIFIILRTINLLLRKHPILQPAVELGQVFAYLQLNQYGLREEVLIFFSNCCNSLDTASSFFVFILDYYPWTHRNKYLLLSCILQTYPIETLLQHSSGHSAAEFFNGLRLSLAYKRLLSPSQYLVKALSRQESKGLLELAADILTNGTFKEIQNFHANWFSRISQKDALIHLLFERLDVILQNFTAQRNEIEEYRFVLIFSMYCRKLHDTSKCDFFRISTELITNCLRFQAETKLLIYKFVVDNLHYFAIEDILEFLATFIVQHKSVDNAQLRNNILGKITTIINYVAKYFRKAQKHSNESESEILKASITAFFRNLSELIEAEVGSKIYQPKIYTLKLLEVLLKSLYQEKVEKNAKNCVVNENKTLGRFLIANGVFDGSKITAELIAALNDPTGFDDALDLIVQLLKSLVSSGLLASDLTKSCQKCCESVDIDECTLSTIYAGVVLNISSSAAENCMILQEYALKGLNSALVSFQADPLDTCKRRCHIFGFINIINVTLACELVNNECSKLNELIDLLELIVNLILELLLRSSSASRKYEAADFQDIDESLQILVKNSDYHAESEEKCRKFLLMSFWLTLKACCDAATTLGMIFSDHDENEINCEKLERCLKINVAVLTRCRHKGAIEAAGISIGKLTKHITKSHKTQLPMINKMLCDALCLLFQKENLVSTTRRGAGFSIMFLHIIKNDEQIEKPMLKHVMREIFQHLRHYPPAQRSIELADNCDRIEALCLHYLCVLSQDAELREEIAEYRKKIILAAIEKIDDPEWTICNAALQLFGALIPKIVGQKQATESEVVSDDWESAVVTFVEIASSMPETVEYIINYCREHADESRFTRSIILFLGFLSKLEHFAHGKESQTEGGFLYRLRELMWSLLQHREEKVRKLSALVFVRAHEFRDELPQMLLTITCLLFSAHNENFFEGLIFVIQFGVSKMQHEALYTIVPGSLSIFLQELRSIICRNFVFKSKFKLYTQTKLLEMLFSIGFKKESSLVLGLKDSLQVYANHDEYFKQKEHHQVL